VDSGVDVPVIAGVAGAPRSSLIMVFQADREMPRRAKSAMWTRAVSLPVRGAASLASRDGPRRPVISLRVWSPIAPRCTGDYLDPPVCGVIAEGDSPDRDQNSCRCLKLPLGPMPGRPFKGIP